MSQRLAGAAALRQQAGAGLVDNTSLIEAGVHAWPPRLVPFAMLAAAVVGLAGVGIMPLPAAAALDLGAVVCYLVALRSVLPRGPFQVGPTWLSGMEPAILPLAALAAGSLALASDPGLPWTVLTPLWLALALALFPWLYAGDDRVRLPAWGSTLLAALVITVPVAFFAVAMGAGTPAPMTALGVGLGALVPSLSLIQLEGHVLRDAWKAAVVVALLMAGAAVLVSRLQVPGPLLPVAMLMGWYGLTGVAAQQGTDRRRSFTIFVVLAAALLAVAAPA
ncbi:MAG: hypothetical protein ACYDD0_08900 [Candidatus Dormibacteria bacterium]